MAGVLQHMYLTALGEWESGSSWAGERAQMGVRIAFWERETPLPNRPPAGSEFVPTLGGDVVSDYGVQAGTHGTLAKSWTARIGSTGSTDNANADTQVELAEYFWTFLDSFKSYVSDDFNWMGVKIAPITATGEYAAPASTYSFTTPLAGGSAANMPPEVSVCVSLHAPVLGRRGRGRMYVPALSSSSSYVLDPTGKVHATFITNMRTYAKTFVNAIDNSSGYTFCDRQVVVMSAGSQSCIRPNTVRIGDHFDVQRRRQHQVPEVYASTAL